MKATGIFLTLFVLFTSTMAANFQNCATINVNYTIFNLCPFAQHSAYNLSDPLTDTLLTFSLGTNRVPECNGNGDIWAVYNHTQRGTCEDIAVKKPTYSLINSEEPSEGLVITFPIQNQTTQAFGINHQLKVTLVCNNEQTNLNDMTFTRSDAFTDDLTIVTLTGYSKYGCPMVSLNPYIDFVGSSEYYLAAIFGVVGLILCYFGLTLFKFAVFTITFTAGTILTGSIFFEFTDLGTERWILWVTFAGSLLIGLALGVIALKAEKLAHSVVGGSLGVVGGLIVYNAFLAPIITDQLGTFPLYFMLILCAVIGVALSLYMFEKILISATAVIGAFLAVRSVSIFIGGFPLESFVAEGIQKYDAAVIAYLVAIVLLFVTGMYYQFKNRVKKEKLDSDEMEKETLIDKDYFNYV